MSNPKWWQALRDAVVAAYPKLSHRYYALKAKWLGLEQLEVWDRNAPLPTEAARTIGLARSVKTWCWSCPPMQGSRRKLADLAGALFSNKGWIDAAVTPGKAPGAFAHPTVTDAHPFVMLNYLAKPRDVMTLAHELGHGVHQRLAAGQERAVVILPPLTLAENRLCVRRNADLPPDAGQGV